MQGKNTVVFVEGERALQAHLVAEALNKDKDFLGIEVPLSALSTKSRFFYGRAKRVLNNVFLRPICAVLRKLTKKVNEREYQKGVDGAKKGRVHNMLFRYAPSAVVVSDVNALETMKRAVKDARSSLKILVLAEDIGFEYDLVDRDVDAYIVDDITVRNELLKRGVYADDVHVSPLAAEAAYYAEKDPFDVRTRLGFAGDEKILAVFPTPEDAEELLAAVSDAPCTLAVVTGDDDVRRLAASKGYAVVQEELAADVLLASRLVAFSYDPYLVKRAAATRCPTLLFVQKDAPEDARVRYLAAGEKVFVFSDKTEFLAISERFIADPTPEKEEEETESIPAVAVFDEVIRDSEQSVADAVKRRLTLTDDNA